MSWKDALIREAVREAGIRVGLRRKRPESNLIRGLQDHVEEAREEKEKMGERATQAASKSAKDGASLQRRQPTWLRNLVILLLLRGKRRSIIGRLLYFSAFSFSLFFG